LTRPVRAPKHWRAVVQISDCALFTQKIHNM
jgi:hypothetical protein